MTGSSIVKYALFFSAVLPALQPGHLLAEGSARYEAVFVDGRRIYGDKVSGWGGGPEALRLDDAALMDAKRPMRWLRDRTLKAWTPNGRDGYIEFVGGDRIVGRIEGVGDGDGLYVPAHLLVKPAATLGRPHLRILPGRIERVVFRPSLRRRLAPGTLYYRSGRRGSFVQLRWRGESVSLLLKDGVREVPIADIDEIHLPRIDPWEAYYQALAVLSPDCRSRLMRIETTGGLIATSSSLRFSLDGEAKRHIVQPVWSLDPLRVPLAQVRMRWSFAPERVPLCRIRPVSSVSPPLLKWRINRSYAGGPLRSGGRDYAWGIAVHAYSELRFPLPKCASDFRSDIGLDNSVGGGGCARAKVYVGSIKNKPAYVSPLLIGSKKTIDTGGVRLALPEKGTSQLILQADPADRESPSNADPLNIRDKLNWLDPQIELDPEKLRRQVAGVLGPLLTGEPGWRLRSARDGRFVWTTRFDAKAPPEQQRFWSMLQARGGALSLSREMTIGADDKWLVVQLGVSTGENHKPDAVSLRVGERRIPARKVPLRQTWQAAPTPLAFPISEYAGKKVILELIQGADAKPLHWQSVATSPVPPAAYRLVDVMEFVGKGDMKVHYGLGLALRSKQISRAEKLAALEINELGGTVNFRTSPRSRGSVDTLDNIMIGRDWTGGDKTFIKHFATFKKMQTLKSLLVTEESGVSDGAIAKLKTALPKLTVSRLIKRIASKKGGAHRPVVWRNLCKRDVTILWINQKGKLKFSVTKRIRPGEELKRHAFVGIRYEAHYIDEDRPSAEDYRLCQPLSSFLTAPNAVWEIKPGR